MYISDANLQHKIDIVYIYKLCCTIVVFCHIGVTLPTQKPCVSLIAKLKIKADQPLWLVDAPAKVKALFKETEVKTSLPAKGKCSQMIFFALNKNEMDAMLPKINEKLADDALFWIAYPKKSGNIQSDLIRDSGWVNVFGAGFVGVSSVSIDDDWTGMRFRKKDPDAVYKSSVPMEQRKTEGIDYVKRTVELPKDALVAMKPHGGLADFFYAMAFTHKKEHVEAIVDAKKPETRQRRIEKMIEMVLKMKADKEKKKK